MLHKACWNRYEEDTILYRDSQTPVTTIWSYWIDKKLETTWQLLRDFDLRVGRRRYSGPSNDKNGFANILASNCDHGPESIFPDRSVPERVTDLLTVYPSFVA